ncbi:glutathione synthase/ribosomal protein S6 modification enzyme (glutaminyl transferase) [Cenarchaeum symbiosum A]|uniref:Glutathione synthase/ribosomal protein S6 modification enzyme (Glutaminyl transferase) n=1 Tax=Cenarchaeum symbiosum (strain A) TaxID=414004 RepID=A0RTV2_CENSY|nr:glutathione synthase/ribosomal protein S6 modification enzyme (glutaminyl transferase) [Cenarchaeum symbiosum A]
MTRCLTVLYDTIRWEEKALLEAGKKKGADVRMVDCKKLALDLDGDSGTEYGTVLQRCVSYYRNVHSTAALEGMGVPVINCLRTGMLAGNKLYTHMLLRKKGVATPAATVAFSREAALESLDKGGYPRVIKPTVGSWGRMIAKLNDHDSAEGIMELRDGMYPIYQIHYLEEFVKRPPRDIRVIMVGDKAVAAIYRYSGDDHWKTNMALGGRAEPCPVGQELEEICIKAKDAVEGQIVGVDLMESDERGYVVHEVNNTTEYKNTVRVCEVDIPSLMIDYALDRC